MIARQPTLLSLHRVSMILLALGIGCYCAYAMRWDWLHTYWNSELIQQGIWTTIWIFIVSWGMGIFLAVWIGLAQAAGPFYVAIIAKCYCSIVRGTPLLLQLWMFYYGIGSLLSHSRWVHNSALWPYLREAWPYAVLSLTLCFAGYEGEVMRGAFLSVPKGQLETARAFGMSRLTVLRRIWLPLAIRRVLPTLGGEAVLLLKSVPLVATITVVDIYSVADRIRQDTYIVYEPLLMLASIYMIITGLTLGAFRWVENRVMSPGRSGEEVREVS